MPSKVYKLTFANNEVIACKAVDNVVLSGLYNYEHQHGKLIYAFIKADSEEQAIAVSHTIVFDLKMQYEKRFQ